ncbi:MAG TPA: DUF4266 domain-containing protein [Nitrosomonas sp.]|nr:DUF4266 domain-containing protein [Nitrosomonas sp.]HQX13033.1 DUF4266 domain-containing protein [Nitrosomonas sp.]HRB21566.1 DUF4266 domain-containing protein [Nitrosomonas sp.]HRB32777.1 DUF4266 domain-containing protein [Nitrosomonas sp.]HRB45176.1 DUF4266 domain-containing protein [Nitrosomonas sp.]
MLNTVNIGLLLATIFFCFFLTGCVNVAVWERGNLAKASMEIDPNPLQSDFQAHNYSSREAAPSHKSSSGGGGCGCY